MGLELVGNTGRARGPRHGFAPRQLYEIPALLLQMLMPGGYLAVPRVKPRWGAKATLTPKPTKHPQRSLPVPDGGSFSVREGSARCWRDSRLLALTGWGDEFHRSSELGIHLLSSSVLKRRHGLTSHLPFVFSWPVV